ncbi:HAD hydrolase subfamily IA REG-2-like protein [Amylostereum chailletii]|nr:HAD hydrolase subfamily IA REG-2-like protein [Amylostereum chailletii]
MSTKIRLVTFDALHTLITPRKPFHVQYSEVFTPYFGALEPDALARSFKRALKQVAVEQPAYKSGVETWWTEVIRRTATGAGADPAVVDKSLKTIVPRLMRRFSSREGYRLFGDAGPSLRALEGMGVKTGLVTNADSRILKALSDLGALKQLSPIVVSEREGMAKPSPRMFLLAAERARVMPAETVHVGDDYDEDYVGAKNAAMHSFLLRRPGEEGKDQPKEPGEDLSQVRVATSLSWVVNWVRKRNEAA